MNKLIIIIRGHIRNSFNNKNLLNKIIFLINNFDVDIYIQTWNRFEASKSWRYLEEVNTIVSKEKILSYFNVIKDKIKEIEILNENNINIVGEKNGLISCSRMPILNWKYMIYGIYHILDLLYSKNINYDKVLNLRFDLFDHDLSLKHLSIGDNQLLSIIKNYKNDVFLFKYFTISNVICVDNILLSSLDSMYKLYKIINFNLDSIIKKHINIIFQESIILFESLNMQNFYKYIVFGFNNEIYKYINKNNIAKKDIIVITNYENKDINYNKLECSYKEFLNVYNHENTKFIIDKNLEYLIEFIYTEKVLI